MQYTNRVWGLNLVENNSPKDSPQRMDPPRPRMSCHSNIAFKSRATGACFTHLIRAFVRRYQPPCKGFVQPDTT